MEFDKSRVYTAVNADELKVGSKVYVSDNMHYLRECVEDNFESCILTRVMSEKEAKRFRLGYGREKLSATITKIELVDGKDTDLHIDKPVYAIHFYLMNNIQLGGVK